MKRRVDALGAKARFFAVALSLALASACPFSTALNAYELNRTVPDKRNAANAALGTCPQLDHFDTTINGGIDRGWNTTIGANIRTLAGQTISDVRGVVNRSFEAWTGVPFTSLTPAALGTLNESSSATCSSLDGLNTICFAQNDPGFTSGVLAFTLTVTSDVLGETYGSPAQQASFIGEILDADILVNPNSNFSTPSQLAANPSTFDLESVLTHEVGHMFGLSHSGVWRAMMFPFAPFPGSFLGQRSSPSVPDGPLADDDRAGLRTLYPEAGNTTHVGVISGRILPVNPLSLADQPGVTGIFGGHVVAVDMMTGAVMGAALSGWSCSGAGPVVFDGSYRIEHLPVDRSYKIYVEPYDGPVPISSITNALDSICRPYTSDGPYPAQFSCTRPQVFTNFVTRVKP